MTDRFTTVSGKYYVGMKREQAKDKKKFDKIDKNKDKMLQGREICDERDREADKYRLKSFAYGAGGVLAMCGSGISDCTIFGVPVGYALAGVGIASLCACSSYDTDANVAEHETKMYIEKHKLDANF